MATYWPLVDVSVAASMCGTSEACLVMLDWSQILILTGITAASFKLMTAHSLLLPCRDVTLWWHLLMPLASLWYVFHLVCDGISLKNTSNFGPGRLSMVYNDYGNSSYIGYAKWDTNSLKWLNTSVVTTPSADCYEEWRYILAHLVIRSTSTKHCLYACMLSGASLTVPSGPCTTSMSAARLMWLGCLYQLVVSVMMIQQWQANVSHTMPVSDVQA